MNDKLLYKAMSQLDLVYLENGFRVQPNPAIIKDYIEGKPLSELHQKEIDKLSPKQKKLLTKKNLEKAAAEFDERAKLEQDVIDAKRRLAEDKLADLGLTKEDLMELLRS